MPTSRRVTNRQRELAALKFQIFAAVHEDYENLPEPASVLLSEELEAQKTRQSLKLLDSVYANRSNDFSIFRLRDVYLDKPLPRKYRPQCYSTLFEYAACFANRAVLIRAILNAGANPLSRGFYVTESNTTKYVNCDEISPENRLLQAQVKVFLKKISISYGAWLLVSIIRMRLYIDLIPNYDLDDFCQNSEIYCSCQEFRTVKSVPNSHPFLIQFQKCKHVCCEFCFWRYLMGDCVDEIMDCEVGLEAPLHFTWDRFHCPLCPPPDSFKNPLKTIMANIDRKITNSLGQSQASVPLTSPITPQQRCAFSHQLWQDHPHEEDRSEDESNETRKARRPKAKLLNFEQDKAFMLGVSKEKKAGFFQAASSINDVYRMAALFCAGIDVNQIDECGDTPLLIAAHYGNKEAVDLLLLLGADPNIKARIGCSLDEVIEKSKFSSFRYKMDGRLSEYIKTKTDASFVSLIPTSWDHAGAGAFYMDNIFEESFVAYLKDVWDSLPVTDDCLSRAIAKAGQKRTYGKTCARRRHFTDHLGTIVEAIEGAVKQVPWEEYFVPKLCGTIGSAKRTRPEYCIVYPRMRFLYYDEEGGRMEPHVDLSKRNPRSRMASTHTVILYLDDCSDGGETVLLKDLSKSACEDANAAINFVEPRRGRLLIFPHNCPHEGLPVLTPPKLLLRGEIIIS